MDRWVGVAVDVPLPGVFTYRWNLDTVPERGMRVAVPWGSQKKVGVVWDTDARVQDAGVAHTQIKPVAAVLDAEHPLPPDWLALVEFASQYYHHPIGQTVADALPRPLRTLGTQGAELRSMVQLRARLAKPAPVSTPSDPGCEPELNDEQIAATRQVLGGTGFGVHVLFGITGSGKTEVYMHCVRAVVNKGGQCLVLLPEINLTPQAQRLFEQRLAGLKVAVLHSGLPDMQRMEHWMRAARGEVDVVIATRLGIFTPMPRLGLIVVDEEHDPSYKQMEGLKYSARDLAVMRAQQADCAVLLGSATPSLESWHKAQSGAYRLLKLTRRAVSAAALPQVDLINTGNQPVREGLSQVAMQALQACFERGKQSIVFLNRRGYAPILACGACGWVSHCKHCTSHMVWHRVDKRLCCHHCGAVQAIPKQCPTCGNQDLSPFGRGTQRIEEAIAQLLPGARVLRIDADSTRNKGEAEKAFATAHAGQADVLVGTQMIAKGHDFKNVDLVLALNVDAGLFSHSVRAPERLFAQLMQVAGRAGRHGGQGHLMVQTRYPHHPLFEALVAHDYEQFAATELKAREAATMPPFGFQALLRADHAQLDKAMAFLAWAKAQAQPLCDADPSVWACEPVPLTVVRVAQVERAQLLVESTSRPSLHRLLGQWLPMLWQARGAVRWFIEVDPQDI